MKPSSPSPGTPAATRTAQRLTRVAALAAGLSLLALDNARAGGSVEALSDRVAKTEHRAVELPSIYLLPGDGFERARPAHGVGLGSHAPTEPDAPRLVAFGGHRTSRARLVEMPADVIPGRYTRPKYALGFRSHGMKKFANSLGLDAHTCLAPLVRARINFSQDGDAGGRLMLFARCSLR